MKLYTKPIITIDSGLAEGVYAASGAASESGNAIPIPSSNVTTDWGSSGQASFNLDLSNVSNHSSLVVVMTFNMDITSGWGDGASAQTAGKNLTLSWYDAPASAVINVQANGDIKQLQCTSVTYSNS